jgi:hypothetical protein
VYNNKSGKTNCRNCSIGAAKWLLAAGCLVNKANLSLDGVHIIWFINQTSDNSRSFHVYVHVYTHTHLSRRAGFSMQTRAICLGARSPRSLSSFSFISLCALSARSHPLGNAHVHQCNSFLSRVLLATPLPHFAQKCAPFVREHYSFHASLLKLQSQSINLSLQRVYVYMSHTNIHKSSILADGSKYFHPFL